MALATSTIGAITGGIGVAGSILGAKKDREAARDATQGQQQLIAQQAGIARGDINQLFPQAQQARDLGFQQSLNVLGGALPQQAGLFQQGNVGAQQALLQGLPQFQNAILGMPTDLNALQPQSFDFNFDFLDPFMTQPQQNLTGPPSRSIGQQTGGFGLGGGNPKLFSNDFRGPRGQR